MDNFQTYQSPYTWRYGSQAMRRLWSERQKRLIWRKIWVALAEVQVEYGLVAPEQAADLRKHAETVDVPRALEIEAQIHHDLMAEVQTFAEQAKHGGGIIHLGATSMDIEDNADVLRLRDGLELLIEELRSVLRTLSRLTDTHADTTLMAFTHIQPAEPSTLGYRLAQYAQDLLQDLRNLKAQARRIRGKGFKGAVGTSASYVELIGAAHVADFEQKLSQKLGLEFYVVATQTYPRKQDYEILSALAGMAQSLYKLAFDLRLLQSPPIGELSEPFGKKQVGSSAMPFKRNPIRAEKIDSLGRYLAQLPRIAWDNAAHSLLERTLDDSANRRTVIPEAFLAADEMLQVSGQILSGLNVDTQAMARNLATYGPFAATERVMMAAVKAGADRQVMHECIRVHAMQAWHVIRTGGQNPLAALIAQDPLIRQYLSVEQVQLLMDFTGHIGNAPQKAREVARTVLQEIDEV